jgi:ribosomal protein S18 acetylase RimI-like enzyme
MTDVLGVCTSWGDGECVVVPESGEAVVIRLRDIVSGKPVPPRPSVRHRVSVRAAEEHTLHLWPGLVTERLGEWVLRTDPAPAGRLVKRMNSALAIGDPGLPLPEALARIRDFYVARDRPVLVQVEAGSAVEEALVAEGWSVVPGGDAHFLLGSLSRALRAARAGGSAGSRQARRAPLAAVETHEDGDRVVVALGDAARGEASLHDDWLGLHGLAVAPDQRRRGLATAVVAELLDWGAERGATTAWLHVEVDNAAGLALYEGLGLTVHHGCRYLRP